MGESHLQPRSHFRQLMTFTKSLVVGWSVAFAFAVVACGLTAAAWMRVLAPVLIQKLGLG